MTETPSTPSPAEPADLVHPGWASIPQDEYDLGVSGGWGTPGQHLTGPIPKLRPTLPASESEEPANPDDPESA